MQTREVSELKTKRMTKGAKRRCGVMMMRKKMDLDDNKMERQIPALSSLKDKLKLSFPLVILLLIP